MRKSKAYIQIRCGIEEHLAAGDISLFEFGVYSMVHIQADYETGKWRGSAGKILACAPRGAKLRQIQRALRSLDERGYLKIFRVPGKRGNYVTLIDKYEPQFGALRGKRLDARNTVTYDDVKYVACADDDTDDGASSRVSGPHVTPIPEVQILNTSKEYSRPQELLEIWQAERGAMPPVRSFTNQRVSKCRARLSSSGFSLSDFRDAVRKAAATPFLRGENDRGWRASFDWFIENETRYQAVLEGKYDGGQNGTGTSKNEQRTRNTLEAARRAMARGSDSPIDSLLPALSHRA